MAQPTLKLFDGFQHTTPQLNGDVAQLQRLLVQNGYSVPVDGQFGPDTQALITQFQQAKGLAATGIADDTTWQFLAGQQQPTPPPTAPSVLNANGTFITAYAKEDTEMTLELNTLQQNYLDIVKEISTRYNIPVSVIAGLGSRESHWGLALTPPGPSGTGDGGHGRGLLQVDDRWHVDFINSGQWADARNNIIYGVALMRNFYDNLVKKEGFPDGSVITLQLCVAGYNAGLRRVLESYRGGMGMDYYTAGRNYSQDVLSRAGWFQLWGL